MDKILNKWGELMPSGPKTLTNKSSWHTMIGGNPIKNCNHDDLYKNKYLKYKNKYLKQKK